MTMCVLYRYIGGAKPPSLTNTINHEKKGESL